mgnify:CR=1 FL=1
MAEMTRNVQEQIDFRVGKAELLTFNNSNMYGVKIPMHMNRYNTTYLVSSQQDKSLFSCQNVTYGRKGIFKPLAIYFSKDITEEKKNDIFYLIESEKNMDDPQEQPDLTSLVFVISTMCHVNIRLELGSPDSMYVYN